MRQHGIRRGRQSRGGVSRGFLHGGWSNRGRGSFRMNPTSGVEETSLNDSWNAVAEINDKYNEDGFPIMIELPVVSGT